MASLPNACVLLYSKLYSRSVLYTDQRFVLIYLPVCLQSTSVGSCYLFCPCFFINFAVVYPETKGVPLEEMDAVFGEGASFIILS
jgi:hypothetical protein